MTIRNQTALHLIYILAFFSVFFGQITYGSGIRISTNFRLIEILVAIAIFLTIKALNKVGRGYRVNKVFLFIFGQSTGVDRFDKSMLFKYEKIGSVKDYHYGSFGLKK